MSGYSRTMMGVMALHFCLIVYSGASAAEYRIRYLNPLPGQVSTGFLGMSDSGVVLGTSEGEDHWATSVVWGPDGSVASLDGMLGDCINGSGQIAGLSNVTGHVVVRDVDGTIRTLGEGGASSINDSGQIGGSVRLRTASGEIMARAAIWDADGVVRVIDNRADEANSYIVDINESGVVVGKWYYRTDYLEHGFMWSEATGWVELGTYGGSSFLPNAISNDGRIAGITASEYRPTLRNPDGSFTPLGDLSFAGCTIADTGEIFINEGERIVMIGVDGSYQLLPAVGSWPDCAALDVNSSGWIGGQCWDHKAVRSVAVVWEPVPEPSSIIGLVCGLSLLGNVLLRKEKGE